jgi:hypothetical protein
MQASQPRDVVKAADDLNRYLNDAVTAQIDWKKFDLFEWSVRSPYIACLNGLTMFSLFPLQQVFLRALE